MLHISTMQSRNIPIRFDEETISHMEDVASHIGITRSALVKMAVALQLREILSGSINVHPNRSIKGRFVERLRIKGEEGR